MAVVATNVNTSSTKNMACNVGSKKFVKWYSYRPHTINCLRKFAQKKKKKKTGHETQGDARGRSDTSWSALLTGAPRSTHEIRRHKQAHQAKPPGRWVLTNVATIIAINRTKTPPVSYYITTRLLVHKCNIASGTILAAVNMLSITDIHELPSADFLSFDHVLA